MTQRMQALVFRRDYRPAFVAAHPEIVRSPAYYLGEPHRFQEPDRGTWMWRELMNSISTGFLMLGLGMVVLLALALPVLILGLFVLRIPFDEVAGIVAGACGNPAILAYASQISQTERPDIAYAMIFPSMTIVKVIAVQIVGLLVATGAG